MFKLHNWVQELVQLFTFYGARAGGGGTFGGGKPSSLAPQGQPMQQQTQPMFANGGRPFNPQANQNAQYLINNERPINLASQGMPPMSQGLLPSQGLPMQGGQFAGGGGKPSSLAPQGQFNMPSQPMFAGGGRPFNPQAIQNMPYLMNFGGGRGPQGMPTMPQGLPQSQSLPMQSNQFAGGGRPFSPQANQNAQYLMNFGGNRLSLGMGMPTQQPQALPMQGGAFAGGGRPFSPQANQNMPYLINNKPLPNFTS